MPAEDQSSLLTTVTKVIIHVHTVLWVCLSITTSGIPRFVCLLSAFGMRGDFFICAQSTTHYSFEAVSLTVGHQSLYVKCGTTNGSDISEAAGYCAPVPSSPRANPAKLTPFALPAAKTLSPLVRVPPHLITSENS